MPPAATTAPTLAMALAATAAAALASALAARASPATAAGAWVLALAGSLGVLTASARVATELLAAT